MKKVMVLLVVGVALMAARPAKAQGGCDDSPENPTLTLAGLAGGVYGVSELIGRLRRRR